MASEIGVQTIQHTNGTNAMTIDSSGRVLTPARPAFSVYLNSHAATADNTSVGVIPFDTEDFDIGNRIQVFLIYYGILVIYISTPVCFEFQKYS